MTEDRQEKGLYFARNAILLVGAVLCLLVVVRLIFIRSWNYDELFHAHLAWLVSIGYIPYRDFPINHFPLLWLSYAPLMKIMPHTVQALTILRIQALALNGIYVVSLGLLISQELQPKQRIWAWAFFGVILFNPTAMHYLIEFRPDPLAGALLFPALLLLRLRGMNRPLIAFASGFCIALAVLINTKCILLPCVLAAVAFIACIREIRKYVVFMGAVCAGFAAALLVSALFFAYRHVPFDGMWIMVVSYNALREKARLSGLGLLNSVLSHPVELAYVLAGVVCYATFLFKAKRWPGIWGTAIFLFLALNLVTNTRPWKQYLVQWFFLAAWFPVCAFGNFASKLNPKLQVVAAICLVVVLVNGIAGINVTDPNGIGVDRWDQDHLITWVSQNLPPDAYVIAGFPMNPVFRQDTFYENGVDITSSGDESSTQLFKKIAGPYGERLSVEAWQKEMETRPPAIIVERAIYPTRQMEFLKDYLIQHSGSYAREEIPGTSVVLYRKVGND